MSDFYPRDRHRDRREKGEQPYKDARETLSENEAELRNKADEPWLAAEDEGDEARAERLKSEAEDRLKKVQNELDKP